MHLVSGAICDLNNGLDLPTVISFNLENQINFPIGILSKVRNHYNRQ